MKSSGHEATIVSTLPRSAAIADRGIETTQDFLNFQNALLSDLLSKRLTVQEVNAATNTSGKMLKAAELQRKHGRNDAQGRTVLMLADKVETETKK
jgi:hypothetical protein